MWKEKGRNYFSLISSSCWCILWLKQAGSIFSCILTQVSNVVKPCQSMVRCRCCQHILTHTWQCSVFFIITRLVSPNYIVFDNQWQYFEPQHCLTLWLIKTRDAVPLLLIFQWLTLTLKHFKCQKINLMSSESCFAWPAIPYSEIITLQRCKTEKTCENVFHF